MRKLFIFIFAFSNLMLYAQRMKITTLDKSQIETTILNETAKDQLLKQLDARQNNSLRKKWTARTFQLSDGRIIIEFYDRQAILLDNIEQFRKLAEIRFVKNTIDFLKKNISYKIELTFEAGQLIADTEKPKRLSQFKSDLPQWYEFEVYQLNTAQILFLDKSENFKAAAIFPDIKTLAAQKTPVLEEEYGSDDDEHLMKKLASGDRLPDYDRGDHLIYPRYLEDLVKNHKLTLFEQKLYVSDFFGNLYKSENGYYMLVDEVKQKNGAGKMMPILNLRIYDSIEQVRRAEKKYKESRDNRGEWEHFYQKISNHYGDKFPTYVTELVEKLPSLLNFDREQLSFDSTGMDIVDEALKWNGTNHKLFDSWFPSVLAYYGQCYIAAKQDGKWVTTYDKEDKVWIPELRLGDGTSAWDWRDFYKDLYEAPIPIRWAGDWDGMRKKIKSNK